MRIGYTFLQWTWGIIQNVAGGMLFLLNVRYRHYRFRGAVVTEWRLSSSLGCGMFIFHGGDGCPAHSPECGGKLWYDTLVHEYGHTLQSAILGPFFLPVIAIPSLLWASLPVFKRARRRRKRSYYWLYCEKWANSLGDKVCRNGRRY